MNPYRIDLAKPDKRIFSGHLKLGGSNPLGGSIAVNNYCILAGGKPAFGVCGEFHFSRCPERYWEEELLKLSAAGVGFVSTYVFWNHHEEEEGKFGWSGGRDVGKFLDLCSRLGFLVFLRIGPFAHGEARNGGLPDWLYGRPFRVRSNDPAYLDYVRKFFLELGRQTAGRMYGDGGPVVALQLENEHMAASAPWEFQVTDEYEWVHKGSGGAEHIKALRALAQEAGLEAPLLTCTGWDNGSFIEGETLPVYGGYCWQPWTALGGSMHKPTDECLIRDFHEGNYSSKGYSPSSTKGRYPYVCGELGGGMACWYRYRFQVSPESVLASTVARIAGGCNFLGYYMFHDGTNPTGLHSYLNERVVPKNSYNFQAPIGEYGQIRESYRLLKPLFYFLDEFGERLCPMGTALPEGAESIRPDDLESLRFAVRCKGGSGFVFLVNYQDHAKMPDREGVRIALDLPGDRISLPSDKGFSLKSGVSAVLPFNFDLGGVLMKYAAAQLIASVEDAGVRTYFFFTPEGMEGEYLLDVSGIASVSATGAIITHDGTLIRAAVSPGTDCLVDITAKDGGKIRICTLTAEQGKRFWKFRLWGKERIILSGADLTVRNDSITAVRAGNPEIALSVFPSAGRLTFQCGTVEGEREGLFTTYRIRLTEQDIRMELRRAGPANAEVSVSPGILDGLEDVLMRVDYLGSVGNAFIAGRLVADDFCNGSMWEIGLKRFFPEIAEKGMYFHVIPCRKGGEIVFEPGLEFRHEFNDGETAEIFSIEAVPVYRADIGKP